MSLSATAIRFVLSCCLLLAGHEARARDAGSPSSYTNGEEADLRPRTKCPESFVLVLDVGHTPEQFGTRTARGRTEYAFNLALANFIRARLEERDFKKVYVLTMHGGLEMLARRAIEANKLNAELLLSIHHDSVKEIFLKNWTYNGKQEKYNDDFSGYSLFVSERNPRWEDALLFARGLSDQLLGRDLHFTLHHADQERRELLDERRGIYRFDDLVVLRSFNGPAVLLEAAVVVNRDEEIAAESPERHRVIADSIFDALEQYCESRSSSVNSLQR